jgi:quinol monooxygenase YgiN
MNTVEATKVTKALLVRVRAKDGKEADVEAFLNQGLSLVGEEPGTVRWFAVRFGPSEFGIFDAFPDDAARRTHLEGPVGKALGEITGELIDEPTIEELDVLFEKEPA